MRTGGRADGRRVPRWGLEGVGGSVVVIDVIRAFTTAAYAFGAGADAIYVVSGVEEALRFKADHPGVLAMGENHGRRPQGFDFPNSPAAVSRVDLSGRTLVQRTSAGTQGVVAAGQATRLWAASLVCASATARAVTEAGLGDPTYVITSIRREAPHDSGHDDRLAADVIERVRLGQRIDPVEVATTLLATAEASRTLALGLPHCDPMDIELASRVDAFDFAMEVVRDGGTHRLQKRPAFTP